MNTIDRSTEALDLNTVFVGLTRPPMMLGITMDYLGVSIIAVLCGFILFNTPLVLLFYVPLHVTGVVLCAIDHNIFAVLMKQLNCIHSPNQRYWGCHSYDPS